jgi:hypothetical protein
MRISRIMRRIPVVGTIVAIIAYTWFMQKGEIVQLDQKVEHALSTTESKGTIAKERRPREEGINVNLGSESKPSKLKSSRKNFEVPNIGNTDANYKIYQMNGYGSEPGSFWRNLRGIAGSAGGNARVNGDKAVSSWFEAALKIYSESGIVFTEENKQLFFDGDATLFNAIMERNRHEKNIFKFSLAAPTNGMVKIMKTEFNGGASTAFLSTIEKLDTSLLAIDTAFFHDFYLFDLFNTKDEFSHGDKVYEVIRQVILAYGFPESLLEKVKRIPINYFNNVAFAKTVYRDYNQLAEQYNEELGTNLKLNPPDDSIAAKYKDSDSETPQSYMAALVKKYQNLRPDIISNSYGISVPKMSLPIWTMTIGQDILDSTNFIASATNLDEAIEPYESMTEYGIIEPLFTFIRSSEKYGTIIVGNQTSEKKFEGGFSNTGMKVHVLGKGTSWNGKYIKPDDKGTSFAAPEVAAKLYIAKAFWRKCNQQITAAEARNRLVLSTDLEPSFIGRFASSGAVNIHKLLQSHKGYLVTTTNEIIPFDFIGKKTIDLNYEDKRPGNEFRGMGLNEANKNSSIRGLYYTDNKWFAYFNDQCKWQAIKEPADITLWIPELDKYDAFIDKGKFTTKYKQFVILNN